MCVRPIPAYRGQDGSIFFGSGRKIDGSYLDIPCGQCVECRLERSRQWAVRCMHEAQMHESNHFVTLTYSDEFLPADGSLDYKHFQNFMKRLRKRCGPVRFYMCGEYGELESRPHFHACLFGVRFPDLVLFTSRKGVKLYSSSLLSSLWPFGFASVGEVTFESAAYVARYVMKKVTGDLAESHYSRVDPDTGEVYSLTPEFNHMSLKPGIGATWLDRFTSDVYPDGRCVVRGVEVKPPRYYDKRYTKVDPLVMESVQFERELAGRAHFLDSLPDRLAVREQVVKARISRLKRSI